MAMTVQLHLDGRERSERVCACGCSRTMGDVGLGGVYATSDCRRRVRDRERSRARYVAPVRWDPVDGSWRVYEQHGREYVCLGWMRFASKAAAEQYVELRGARS